MVLAVAVALVSLTGAAMVQQLHTVPFDTALSIYVGHDGTWYRYDVGQAEEAEIEDALGVFAPNEEVSDDPDIWVDHQVNDPPSPSGWTFFSAVDTEPMSLHVMVADTQNRLGQIVVTDRYTGATVGTLTANAQGSSISGSLTVDPTREAFRLELKAKGSGTTMAKFQVISPRVEDGIAVTFYYGWIPNRGDEHAPCAETYLGPPWGNPETYAGKMSTAAVEENRPACCGNTAYTNDQPQQGVVTPKYNLLNHKLLQNVNFDPTGTGGKVGDEVNAALTAARQDYLNGQTYLGQLALLPFSQGVSHFPAELYGQIRSILYCPYKGLTSRKAEIAPAVRGMLGNFRNVGVGHSEVAWALEAGITLSRVDRIRYQIQSPVAVGDLWGLRSSANGGPLSLPTQPLTAPVTFELYGDLVPAPSPSPGLIGGNGSAVKADTAWTPVPPPPPMETTKTLTFPGQGPDLGRCTVQLAKGWRWTATGGSMHYNPGQVGLFDVPVAETKTITANLNLLLCLRLATGTTPCQVELQRLVGGDWQAVDLGNTSLVDGVQTRTIAERPTGVYRARAKRQMGPPPPQWGNWTEFQVAIGPVQTQPLTAP